MKLVDRIKSSLKLNLLFGKGNNFSINLSLIALNLSLPSVFRDEQIVLFYMDRSRGSRTATSVDVTLEMSFKHHGRSLALLAAQIQSIQEVTLSPLSAYFLHC